jgi:hypothetical protein
MESTEDCRALAVRRRHGHGVSRTITLCLEKLELRCQLSGGTHTLHVTSVDTDNASNSATGNTPAMVAPFTAPTPTSAGPTVLSVLRYGVHHQPTVLVLQFSKPLNPARAQDTGNYFILSHASRPNPVALAVYNPASQSVVLFPRRKIDIHHPAQLLVIGTAPNGLADTAGTLLNGAKTAQPGSDFSTFINRAILAGPLSRLLSPSLVSQDRSPSSSSPASIVDSALQH